MSYHRARLSVLLLFAVLILALLTGCASPQPSKPGDNAGESKATEATTESATEVNAEPDELISVGNLKYDKNGNFYLDKSDMEYHAEKDHYTIHRIAEDMDSGVLPKNKTSVIHIGNGRITVEDVSDKLGVTSVKSNPYRIVSVEAYGQKVVPLNNNGDALPCYGNLGHTALDIDNHFVFYVTFSGTEMGYSYILGEEGVYEIKADSINDGAAPADKSFGFYEENGKLMFKATTNKYQVMQDLAGTYAYCTSKDECYREDGTVSFEAGAMKLTTQKSVTISERVEDFEKGYETWKESNKLTLTLDEYLKENSQKYPTAVADKEVIFNVNK